jgi:cytochrome c-type biogenesis protein CcmH/NrfG
MEQTPENTEYRYYLGHAYIALNDWNAAIDAFASTERSAPFALAQRAAWNRALALLAAGRDAEGVALLEAIAANAGHGFSRQAGELLGKRKR